MHFSKWVELNLAHPPQIQIQGGPKPKGHSESLYSSQASGWMNNNDYDEEEEDDVNEDDNDDDNVIR